MSKLSADIQNAQHYIIKHRDGNSRSSIVNTLRDDLPLFMLTRSVWRLFGVFEGNNYVVWLRHWESRCQCDWQLGRIGHVRQFLLQRIGAFALVCGRQFGLYVGQEFHVSLVHHRFQSLQKHSVIPRIRIFMVRNDFFGVSSDCIYVGSGVEVLHRRIFESL